MNCKFCYQPCISSSTPESSVQIERCYNHPYTVKHLYLTDNPSHLEYIFTVPYKGHRYNFNFSELDIPSLSPYCLEVSSESQMFLSIDEIPNITPENALDKLPTIITFS